MQNGGVKQMPTTRIQVQIILCIRTCTMAPRLCSLELIYSTILWARSKAMTRLLIRAFVARICSTVPLNLTPSISAASDDKQYNPLLYYTVRSTPTCQRIPVICRPQRQFPKRSSKVQMKCTGSDQTAHARSLIWACAFRVWDLVPFCLTRLSDTEVNLIKRRAFLPGSINFKHSGSNFQ